ncbi:MAG: flagellar basal-body rod protein FlgB [Thermotogaceae bacterium]|jgi:flagellar basal-body rod protein FlgB|nr:flagellar basal-body rod protein FlgB [Thermotogaceae bacterium]
MSGLFNSNFSTLPAALDAANIRNTIIAQNIANAETPGYKRKEVDFEHYLQQAMGEGDGLELKKTEERHFQKYSSNIQDVQARVRTVSDTRITNDGNNVDIDQQEALMAANTIRYQTLSRLMSLTIARYNTVLKGVR